MKITGKCIIAMLVLLSSLHLMGNKAAAKIDWMANKSLVVLTETELYDDYNNPESVVGSIAGMQELTTACLDKADCLANAGGKDYVLVKTWMGNKWIEDDDRITAGTYQEVERDITIIEKMPLYDDPDVGVYRKDNPPTETLLPQKVHVTARYWYLYRGAHNGRAFVNAPTWYRIDTKEGQKWIVDPFILEDMQKYEIPNDRIIKLTGNELLYDYPHKVAGEGTKANPGVLQVDAISSYWIKTQSYVWFKLRQEDGTFKWVNKEYPLSESESGPLTQFSMPNEKITLRTATRYFDIDGDSSLSLQTWLQPGTYIADKINGGWARIQTPFGWKVVNLDRAPLERPQGITETQEVVKLTPETKSYYFPLTGEVCHEAGTFSNQDALSFEKWISPEGVKWYHISTYSGIVWVPEKPLQ
ncbi:hypothetical protein [Gorillibacterium sp. sgz5001074]|uniref:hypothetical protein n=1 Tax=Gorillibacterium sp. sgz5001074 TaxID=3446695 RepID=UPI003F668F3F